MARATKTQRYIETAILARRLRRQAVVVIELADEVEPIDCASGRCAQALDRRAAKLAQTAARRWGQFGGERRSSVFSVPTAGTLD